MEKILVIEDNSPVRDNIKQLLYKAGYEVLTAEDGNEGVKLAAQNLPDVIICDIIMPGMDGYDVLKQLSSSRVTSSIPFIFLTAMAEMTDLRLGMELGADDYLVKPFKAGDLLKAIKTRLGKRGLITKSENESFQAPGRETVLKTSSVILAGNPPEVLRVSSIIYITSSQGYSSVFSKDGKKLLVRKLMREWEEILPEDSFIRIHNSTIVNLEYLERVEKWFNNTLRIYLNGVNYPLEVSKRYTPRVRARLRV
ncbi:MAG: response regulator transcription factor [Ignavibacteria bacterium]|jgi:DNA-binding LytR/AlgR family response regulator|nr:response regulator transcription factor [Ignavibacteria bacterium]MCU7504910.1 response regulator transcription factor [Ignavibacteria bacterium]MCU7517798.1 response regulator transcription factor [Ignavibacteria bacterium]